MSDTPRTDKQEHFIDGDRGIVDSGLARELERELNAANSIIRQQQLLDEENLSLRQHIKRLEAAGDQMIDAFSTIDNKSHWNAILNWTTAKEAKP